MLPATHTSNTTRLNAMPKYNQPLNAPSRTSRQSSSFGECRAPSAFTLIELLIVIAIIAILAGLAFPAMQGALGSGKKAQARNDIAQLVAAAKSFQLEYARLPVINQSGSDTTPAPNQDVLAALTSSNVANPRGTVFFEPKQAKAGKGGLDGGVYKDPWGTAYQFFLDFDYDGRIRRNNQTNFTTIIVESAGPDGSMNNTNDNLSNLK